jgi:hypothetical protein
MISSLASTGEIYSFYGLVTKIEALTTRPDNIINIGGLQLAHLANITQTLKVSQSLGVYSYL